MVAKSIHIYDNHHISSFNNHNVQKLQRYSSVRPVARLLKRRLELLRDESP